MICDPCAYAADKPRQDWHQRCESASCSCQHNPPGYGRLPEPEVTEEQFDQMLTESEPASVVVLDEARKAALDSVGLTIDELRGKIQSWSADGPELLAWRIWNGEAA